MEKDARVDPLEEPKIYLNVVYSDKILSPLDRKRDIADPKNDKEWQIIPIVFTEPKQRKSLDGLQCIHYDAHVNTCVINKMKEGDQYFKSIMNYIVLRFQEHIKSQFILHKKSIKFIQKKKYKDAKGTGSQKVEEFVLLKEHSLEEFKKVKKRLQEQ